MNNVKNHEPQYECWFHPQPRGSLAFSPEVLSRIGVITPGEPRFQAAAELSRGLERMFRITAETDPLFTKTDAGIVIGTTADINAAWGLSLPCQKAEGFCIRAEERRIIIAGQDEPGLLYGVYRLLVLLAQGGLLPGAEYADAPAASLRIINHWDNLDGTIERGYAGLSLFYKNNRLDYDPDRIRDYARLLASVGINRIAVNNVNVRGAAKQLITGEYLPDLAKLADLFRPFGIRLFISINFSAPYSFGDLPSADPLDDAVAAWWSRRAALIYHHIPDLAGFLVKADSEGEPGPFQYGRSHADGANMLAAALRPHGGLVIWRCFVYNSAQDWRDQRTDRARAAFDHFMPQDGSFADNVMLQIKHGPYDFQVREPVSPLFGAIHKTRHLMELQITQEYTGHQIDLCYLPWMWEWVMNFDTGYGPEARIKDLIGRRIEGIAGVSNVGLDRNWTGHPLAQANLYGYGRLAWQPSLRAEDIAKEWSLLTFGDTNTADTAAKLLLASYPAYEKYTAPFGVCFMVKPGLHYGVDVEGYEFSKWGTYHRAGHDAVGIDRTESGTGYTAQYSPQNARIFSDKEQCPENVLLFFHRIRYDHIMKNGHTLLQNIYSAHFEGCEEAEALYDLWLSLEPRMDAAIYKTVKERMERQIENARQWRDVINTYFYRKTGTADCQGRTIYP